MLTTTTDTDGLTLTEAQDEARAMIAAMKADAADEYTPTADDRAQVRGFILGL